MGIDRSAAVSVSATQDQATTAPATSISSTTHTMTATMTTTNMATMTTEMRLVASADDGTGHEAKSGDDFPTMIIVGVCAGLLVVITATIFFSLYLSDRRSELVQQSTFEIYIWRPFAEACA